MPRSCSIGESIERGRIEDWRWVVDVNLMGVVYGTQVIDTAFERAAASPLLAGVLNEDIVGFAG